MIVSVEKIMIVSVEISDKLANDLRAIEGEEKTLVLQLSLPGWKLDHISSSDEVELLVTLASRFSHIRQSDLISIVRSVMKGSKS